jgi:hypothetical protein
VPKATTVFVCRDCKHHRSVERGLQSPEIAIRPVGCQKVCQQPVVGLVADGSIAWLGKMDDKKRQKALVDYVAQGSRGKLPDALKKVRSKKRSKSLR